MSVTNDGTYAQARIQAALKHLVEVDRCGFMRVYDTRAANTYLPKQPADFTAVLRGASLLIECKSSRKHDSLARWVRSACESHQIASARLWLRAGGAALFVHMQIGRGEMELWSGEVVVNAYLKRTRLRDFEPLRCSSHPEHLAQGLLQWLFQNPPKLKKNL